jgi:hypothetical protein
VSWRALQQHERSPGDFVRLTRRAKHWQNGIIERVRFSPRGAVRGGIFHTDLRDRNHRDCDDRDPVAISGLTRRAKHRHNGIIETSL